MTIFGLLVGFYVGAIARRLRQSLVQCDQECVERLGKRHVGRIVAGEVISSVLDPIEEQSMRVADEPHFAESV